MNRYKRYLPIAAILLVAFGVNLDRFGIDLESFANGGSLIASSPSGSSDGQSSQRELLNPTKGAAPAGAHWSSTEPNINLWHVFEGEINRSGKPVGYHARPGGKDPENARVADIRDKPNRLGVYTARIEVRDGSQWKSKNSSFFPDALSRDEVVAVIQNAYQNSDNPNAQPFEGPSGLGFRVQGYTSNRGGINTAYPIFVRNQ